MKDKTKSFLYTLAVFVAFGVYGLVASLTDGWSVIATLVVGVFALVWAVIHHVIYGDDDDGLGGGGY